MVGFSLKPKKDETSSDGPKKFGGFSLKNAKTQTQKPLKPGLLSNGDVEDTPVKKISITTSEDLKPEEEEEVIISLQPNKSLISLKKEKENSTKDEGNAKLSYGLNVLNSTSDNKDKIEKETVVVPKKRKIDDSEVDDTPNYTKISVDDFGLLFLKGLGYKPEDEEKQMTNGNKKTKKYGNQMGLGSTES